MELQAKGLKSDIPMEYVFAYTIHLICLIIEAGPLLELGVYQLDLCTDWPASSSDAPLSAHQVWLFMLVLQV